MGTGLWETSLRLLEKFTVACKNQNAYGWYSRTLNTPIPFHPGTARGKPWCLGTPGDGDEFLLNYFNKVIVRSGELDYICGCF